MILFEVINCFRTSDSDKVVEALNQSDFSIITLKGINIVNKETFFKQAAQDIPQPNGLVAESSWDALNDNLWSSLYEGNSHKIALVWTDAEELLDNDVQSFLKAVDLFTFFARDISSVKRKTNAKSFILVMLGASANFCNPNI